MPPKNFTMSPENQILASLWLPSAKVSLFPMLLVTQAATGLMPRVRKMTRELVKDASALETWNTVLVENLKNRITQRTLEIGFRNQQKCPNFPFLNCFHWFTSNVLLSMSQWSGCQTSNSASSSKFHHLALLVALVSYSSICHLVLALH